MSELEDLTTKCIRCGFCLESCPTFTETGRETESPRGRIYLMRSAAEGRLRWTQEEVGQFTDGCLGCRACETSCPSGVEYGSILELGRKELNRTKGTFGVRLLLSAITNPRMLKMQLALGRLWPSEKFPKLLSRLLTKEKPEATLPRAERLSAWPEMAESAVPPVKGKVYLLEGCAMRVLYPNVHLATRRLLRRVGFVVEESSAGCCGALHAHQGFFDEGLQRLHNLESAMPLDIPIVVNSAGCGSFMLEHSHPPQTPPSFSTSSKTWEGLSGSPSPAPPSVSADAKTEGGASSRVIDISKFLFENGLVELLRELPVNTKASAAAAAEASTYGVQAPSGQTGLSALRATKTVRVPSRKVAYHDACHLIHGQKVFREPRELLAAVPGVELVDLPESDTCCGSAGIYNLTQPKMARQLLERKWRNIEASGAEIVVMGNPGCHAWIAQAAREHGGSVRVMHTAEVLESAFLNGK